jgi:hypothetical protein
VGKYSGAKPNGIPGSGRKVFGFSPEFVFAFNPECCSESTRNPVRLGPESPTLGLLVGLRLRWIGGFAQALYTLPNLARARFGGLEGRHRLYARQAVPDGYRALGGPSGGEVGSVPSGWRRIRRGGGRSGGFLLVSERADVVFDVDGECHFESPFVSALSAVMT